MSFAFIVTVDTEEEGLWGGQFRSTGNTVNNVQGVSRFQKLCDRFDIRPTYLVDAPVVQDDNAVGLLRDIASSQRCEIGTHLHPWCNPPLSEEINAKNSYMCNLPEDLQRAKLEWLTEKITQRFGQRPTSFRAGRYGLDGVGVGILRDLGYRVDSSVIPFCDYSHEGGPNFGHAPWKPYLVNGDDLCTPSQQGDLLEVPVSVGFRSPNFLRAHHMRQVVINSWLRHFRVVGILDRLGIARRIKFSPEQSNAFRMKELVRAYRIQGCPAMVMLLHSSSLVPGYSPYVKTNSDLEELYANVEAIFQYCRSEADATSFTLSEYAQTEIG